MKIKKNFDEVKKDWKDKNSGTPYPKKMADVLDENSIFNFPDGVPAFEDAKRFVIVVNPKIKPFLYLKSLDIEGLGFICVDPFLVCTDFTVNIPGKDKALLELEDSTDALVLSLVTVDADPKETTTNLLAPIVINIEKNIGTQVILDDKNPVRFRIWEGLENFEKGLRG